MSAVTEEDTVRSCTLCGGRGIVYDPTVEAGRYGSLKVCSCVQSDCRCGGGPPYQYWDDDSQRRWCSCAPARRRLTDTKRRFADADIPSRFRWKFRHDFAAMAPDGRTPLQVARRARRVIDYVSALVDDDRDPQRGYLFHGVPGTGKSLLAAIVLNELLLHRVRPGRYLSLSMKYFQQLKDTFSSESEQYGRTWSILEELCSLPYLILDDFGVQRGTEWEMEMLYNLVDARYSEERFTIVTTNQPLEDLLQLPQGGRIHSRLMEMCYLVDMNGEDYRHFMMSE
ncbi:ATP-binding protein [Candidatus Latescibacterota bacterium]